ncbi:MAG: EAL domain-containing protein [Acidobacteria bacterium]|nr:MAG: EAL domain-containing protein [Acidobacteriota bacterium]
MQEPMSTGPGTTLEPELAAGTRTRERTASEETPRELSALLSRCGALAVLYVDLAELGIVEDQFGAPAWHRIVERLEDAVRRCLGRAMREEDRIVTSLGEPDSLTVWLGRPRDDLEFYRQAAHALGETLDRYLAKHASQIVYPYAARPPRFSVGCGLALHNPATRPEKAFVSAVRRARDHARLKARLAAIEAENELLTIIFAEQIQSVYQPLIEIASGRVFGFEALARGPWSTPWVSPAQLFGVAETAGVTFELDCLCRKAALRGAAGRLPAGAKLFLNTLPSAVHDPAFTGAELQRTLDGCGLQPHDLVFEISERETVTNFDILRRTCDHFRRIGIRIALDDVGSGYASMAAAMDLEPDLIKIDMSLVRSSDADVARQALIASLCALAGKLGAEVVAEGIETEAELETMRRLGVHYGQGYLLGRGRPFDES